VDKIEFFGNFPRNVFCAFAVTLLARPKKCHVGDHSCFASPFCDEQVIVGRKVVLIGFFGQSLSPISHQVTLAVLHRPPYTPENCNGWLLHAPGATTNKMSSGEEVATQLLPPSLAR